MKPQSIFLYLLVLASPLFALMNENRNLKPSSIVEYLKTPGEVQTLQEWISQGKLYGRLRSNAFWYEYDNINSGLTQDHSKVGFGGNLTYKTPFYHGFGATAGFYGAIPFGDDNLFTNTTLNYTKTAKDLYRTSSDGSENSIGVLAVAYGEYKDKYNDLMIGRQIIDTALLASNDAKMIPNTFEAAMLKNTFFDKTTIQIGYITAQKLRDHQNFHSIIAYEKLNENDDASINKGLSVSNLEKMGKDTHPEMLLVSIENKSIPNLRLYGEYGIISGYFSTLLIDLSYGYEIGSGFKLTPSFRYITQCDDGAGAVGGAALSGAFGVDKKPSSKALNSYTNPNSVDGSMTAAKVTLTKGAGQLAFGYSETADKADIINPWRAFPSGGYTRAMAQNTWYANTDSWMIALTYDFDKEGRIPGLYTYFAYSYIDIDDSKSNALTLASTDRHAIHFDAVQTFKSFPNTEFKFRFGAADAKSYSIGNLNDSYQEYRFEINYLF